jgi:hypothetical protein
MVVYVLGETGAFMSGAGSGRRKRSRVITGFHRLGLVLAVTVLLGALGTAISAWFSNDGLVIADPTESPPPLTVYTPEDRWQGARLFTPKDQADIRERIRTKKLGSISKHEMDTGPVRTFAFYPTRDGQTSTQESALNILASIAAFERRRGGVLSAQEQPVLVGDVFVQEAEIARFPYLRWTHLKNAFDWQRMVIAGVIAAFAAFIYIVARMLGWVIDGFVSRTES